MKVFLVHGSFGKPFENWFPWIERELSEIDVPCTIPSFPTPQHQNYFDWEKLMDYYCDMGIVNEDTVLIGHSCGAVFLVHYLLSRRVNVKGLICVSGYNNFISGNEMMDNLNKPFYMDSPDISVKEYAKYVIAFYGDNDPYIPQSFLEGFGRAIGGQVVCIKNAGHFNKDSGYTKCTEVLNAIKEISQYNI